MVGQKRSSFGMQAALGSLITFHNSNQVLIKNCFYGNSRFTTCPPSWPHLEFFQKFCFSQILLKLVENMRLQPQKFTVFYF